MLNYRRVGMRPHSLPVDSDDFYKTLVENSAEGMLTIDKESTIVYANPAIEEILGYTPEELIGSSKMKIIPERLRPVHAAALETYVNTGERNIDWDGIELPALHKDGHEVPTLISLREHKHNGEQYFTGIVRDITERERQKEQLRDQRERLEQFADILAHDIRNPLSVAQSYTDIAQQKEGHPELEKVSDSLSRIDKLVEDILELSKEGQSIGAVEVINVNNSVRTAWSNVDTAAGSLHIDGNLGELEADASRFQDLFLNLFRNAVEHGGSDVEVEVGKLSEKNGLYIVDNGPGISESETSEIFDHGYSTQEDGTGYGLSIVKKIVTAHGWDITVCEDYNSGARFEITGIQLN